MNNIELMMNSPEFWLAIGFGIFVYFSYGIIRSSISQIINDYIVNLSVQIRESEDLLKASVTMLSKIEQQVANVKVYESNIINQTKEFLDQLKLEKDKEFSKLALYQKKSTANSIESLANKYRQGILQEIYAKVKIQVIEKFNNKNLQDFTLSDIEVAKYLRQK
jgi:F0F1-type ATP synthase membrane subunit b/b'